MLLINAFLEAEGLDDTANLFLIPSCQNLVGTEAIVQDSRPINAHQGTVPGYKIYAGHFVEQEVPGGRNLILALRCEGEETPEQSTFNNISLVNKLGALKYIFKSSFFIEEIFPR